MKLAELQLLTESLSASRFTLMTSTMKFKDGCQVLEVKVPDTAGPYINAIRSVAWRIRSKVDGGGTIVKRYGARIANLLGKELGGNFDMGSFKSSGFLIKYTGDEEELKKDMAALIAEICASTAKSEGVTLKSLFKGKMPSGIDQRKKKLISLEGCPSHLSVFDVSDNLLTSLIGGPAEVDGEYYCADNHLISLEGMAAKIGGHLSVSYNELTSLEGCPRELPGGSLFAVSNKIKTLEGVPEIIGGSLRMQDNQLRSLQGIHKLIKKINGNANFNSNPIRSHMLGLLKIDGLTRIEFNGDIVEEIINSHLKGDRNLLACQEELMEAGRGKFAQL